MFRRMTMVVLIGSLLIVGGACHHKKSTNPLAQVDSKQPDTVLFSKAMDAMKHGKNDVARLNLQTLINTYPDSEFIARAKLGIADSWLAEGGAAGFTQAESEYKDFITFFPNMPEAAEAQMKIADIHFRQIEKPDRDFNHARQAEEAYRQLLLQFPDSKLVPQARLKLLQVQEILAERQYRIGHFYYVRETWPAAIARLKSLTDSYPLYSKADDALFQLGDAYEREVQWVRTRKTPEEAKQKLIREYTDAAAAAYTKIVTRYPVMARAGDAKKRLAAMHRPVPTPTQEAIELNKREQASRTELGHFGRAMLNFHKRPDYLPATKVGEPTLDNPQQADATKIVREVTDVLKASPPAAKSDGKVSVETVKTTPAENQPVPRATTPTPAANDNAPAPAPAQVNEVKAAETPKPGVASSIPAQSNVGNQYQEGSSSKQQKKKTGLKKLLPF